MGNIFNAVALAVRKIIHRVYAPLVAGAVVVRMLNAVKHWIAHEHIGMRHINFRSQRFTAIRENPCFHFLKKLQVFFCTAIAVGAVFAGLSGRSF